MADRTSIRLASLIFCEVIFAVPLLYAQRDISRSVGATPTIGSGGQASFYGDLTGDGHDDFGVVDRYAFTSSTIGAVYFFSGATSSIIGMYAVTDPTKHIDGLQIDTLGDFNADGIRDFITSTNDLTMGSNQNKTLRVRTYPSGTQILEPTFRTIE